MKAAYTCPGRWLSATLRRYPADRRSGRDERTADMGGAMTRESALREMSAIRARHADEGPFLYGRLPGRLKDAEAVGRIVVAIYPYTGRDPQPAFIAWLQEFRKVLLEWGLIDPRLEIDPLPDLSS
ncbi:hypothetical protein AB0L44_15065 [Nonomuraea wenchangensis]|uniref:hypothetical protein n=1 Tax=Nonomuraea wenchangensis TaxID=568860 RepID=UPI003434731D